MQQCIDKTQWEKVYHPQKLQVSSTPAHYPQGEEKTKKAKREEGKKGREELTRNSPTRYSSIHIILYAKSNDL